MKIDQAKRLKEVEKENARLKKLVADLSLDNAVLKEVSRGNFRARRDGAGQLSILQAYFRSRNVAIVGFWAKPDPANGIAAYL